MKIIAALIFMTFGISAALAAPFTVASRNDSKLLLTGSAEGTHLRSTGKVEVTIKKGSFFPNRLKEYGLEDLRIRFFRVNLMTFSDDLKRSRNVAFSNDFTVNENIKSSFSLPKCRPVISTSGISYGDLKKMWLGIQVVFDTVPDKWGPVTAFIPMPNFLFSSTPTNYLKDK